MSSISYVINKEKNTVTCILENCKYDLKNIISKGMAELPKELYVFLNCYDFYQFFELPNKIVSTTKCSSQDVFDESLGKKIAYAKMRKKYCKYMRKIFEKQNALLSTYNNFFTMQNEKNMQTYKIIEDEYNNFFKI